MKAGRMIAVAACLLGGALPAVAQDFTLVDLDGRGPSERIYAEDGMFNVLVWNAQRGEWIDVFRSKGDATSLEIGPARTGALANLTVGDREWGWRTSRYVPLPHKPDGKDGAPADVALAAFKAADSAVVPEGGLGFSYSEPDGSLSYFVPVDDPALCSSWLCSGVVVRNGVASLDIGAIIGDRIGPSKEINAQGHRMIEQVKDGELLVMDPDDINVETKIVPGMAVKVAAPQPAKPE